jgi:ERCC4-type nuclease
MRLAIWTHPVHQDRQRAYINDLPCLTGATKAYIEPRAGGVRLVTTDPGIKDEVEDALVEAGVIGSTADLKSMPFSFFESFAQSRAPAGGTRKPAYKARQAPLRDAGGTRHTEAEALDLSTISIPGPVRIRIDHREPDGLFNLFEGLHNVEVERVELPVGDIEINGKYLIERKACHETGARTDFEESVVGDTKRLFFQSEKLRLEDDIIPIVVLEGCAHEHSRGMLVQAVDGMLSYLISIQKLNVLTTYSPTHTAYFALKLAVHDCHGLGYEPPLRVKKPRLQSEQLAFVLEGLPGVSSNLAKRLGDHFGSLLALASASDEELRSVPGMGPKKVEQIKAVLRGCA